MKKIRRFGLLAVLTLSMSVSVLGGNVLSDAPVPMPLPDPKAKDGSALSEGNILSDIFDAAGNVLSDFVTYIRRPSN